MGKTWVVVSESTRARIYAADTPRSPLTEVEDYAHTASRMHAQELTSDLPGRAFDSGGQGRHAMGQKTSPSEREHVEFARTIGQRIEAGRLGGDFENLILVAPPEFLGHLRKNQDSVTREKVVLEIGKNLVTKDAEDIRAHIRDQLG
jgi:protein required for attachment to host cells